MDEKLKILFDFQRFSENDRLSEIIEKSNRLSDRKLTEDELSLVSAAGDGNDRISSTVNITEEKTKL